MSTRVATNAWLTPADLAAGIEQIRATEAGLLPTIPRTSPDDRAPREQAQGEAS